MAGCGFRGVSEKEKGAFSKGFRVICRKLLIKSRLDGRTGLFREKLWLFGQVQVILRLKQPKFIHLSRFLTNRLKAKYILGTKRRLLVQVF